MTGRNCPRKCEKSIIIRIEVSIEGMLVNRMENKKSRSVFNQLTDLLLIVELAVSFFAAKWGGGGIVIARNNNAESRLQKVRYMHLRKMKECCFSYRALQLQSFGQCSL